MSVPGQADALSRQFTIPLVAADGSRRRWPRGCTGAGVLAKGRAFGSTVLTRLGTLSIILIGADQRGPTRFI